jgi:hypothetical protein
MGISIFNYYGINYIEISQYYWISVSSFFISFVFLMNEHICLNSNNASDIYYYVVGIFV